MSIKVSVGLSRKDGLPNYGSIGATCLVECEINADPLGNDLEAFHRSVRDAFTACRQAVHDELARYKKQPLTAATDSNGQRGPHDQQPVAPQGNSNSHSNSHSNSNSNSNSKTNSGNGQTRQATPRQLEFARQLADRIEGLGPRRLELLSRELFQVSMSELTSMQASALINTLKEMRSGNRALPALLPETSS